MSGKITCALALAAALNGYVHAREPQPAPAPEPVVEQVEKVDYRPQIYGVLKTKFEVSTYNGEHRFNVRNSRFGVRGQAMRNLRYAIQIELSSEGKLEVLDSYVALSMGAFELSLGQQQYKFSTELDRGARNYFANRSFVGKFITQYENVTVSDGKLSRKMSSIGSRDIGALLTYSPREGFPWSASLGAYNGEGINNPQWTRNINVVGRVGVGAKEGLAGAASFYVGTTPVTRQGRIVDGEAVMVDCTQKLRMWNLEARYSDARLVVEGEFAQRILKTERNDVLNAAMIQGLYKFPLPANGFADHLSPLLRWDIADNVKFVDADTGGFGSFTANRLTFGLTLGLSEKLLRSEIRLNYEQYIVHRRPSDFTSNNLLHNKFTIEFLAAF